MHEEYQEITTKPIQKIIAPLRDAPLFNKAKHPRGALPELSVATEMAPLLGGNGQGGAGEPPGVARTGAGEASTSSPRATGGGQLANGSADAEAVGAGAAATDGRSTALGSAGVSSHVHEISGSIGGLQRPGDASCSGVQTAPGKAGLRGPGRVKQQSHVD